MPATVFDALWESLPIALELSSVRWSDDRRHFRGHTASFPVVVRRDPAAIAVHTELAELPPFERAARPDATVRMDDVRSDDPGFDAQVCVRALDWNRQPTKDLLSRAHVRAALLDLVAGGGSVEGSSIVTAAVPAELTQIKRAVALHRSVAMALGAPPPVLRNERAAPPRAALVPIAAPRLFDTGHCFVERRDGDRFQVHLRGPTGGVVEVDAATRTIQVGRGARLRFEALVDLVIIPNRGAGSIGPSFRLFARLADGRAYAVGAGERKQLEALAGFLALHGLPALTRVRGWRAWFGFVPRVDRASVTR